MRLKKEEVMVLKETLKNLSNNAKIYLFGSRVDDNKRGGDIDLLIISKDFTKKHLRKLRIEFFKNFGEQKLDIVVDDGQMRDPFVAMIYKKAIKL
jgi:predicted nucleotidyltransferase